MMQPKLYMYVTKGASTRQREELEGTQLTLLKHKRQKKSTMVMGYRDNRTTCTRYWILLVLQISPVTTVNLVYRSYVHELLQLSTPLV